MSKSSGFGFQGGAFVEVFTPQGKDPTAGWKVCGSVRKVFEKEVKSYIYVLEGVPTTTKLQLPKDSKNSVTLVQRFLILQLCLSKGQDFSLELGLTDLGKNKRRVLLSTSQRDIHTTPLHAKIPLSIIKRGIWLNLCFDLSSLVGELWKGQTYRSVESITISANCKLRRVFTMKIAPADTTEDDALFGLSNCNSGEIDQIPRQCQLATDIQQLTQVFTINKLKAIEGLKTGNDSISRPASMLDLDLNASTRKSVITDSNSYRIAFGSKVAISTSRKSGKDNLSTSRSSRQLTGRGDESISTKNSLSIRDGVRESSGSERVTTSLSANQTQRQVLPDQSKSDTAALTSPQLLKGNEKGELAFSQPHPPREPSKDRQRRRIRVKGQGPDNLTNGQTKGANNVVSNEDEANSSSNSKFSSDGDLEETSGGETATEDKGLQTPRYREKVTAETKESGVGPNVPEIQSPRKEQCDTEAPFDESMSDVIRVLREQVMAPQESDSDNTDFGDYVDSDENVENEVYMFASPPKSAPHRNISPSQDDSNSSQSRKSYSKSSYLKKLNSLSSSSRGARLEMDFMDSQSSEDEDEELALKLKPSSRSQSGKSNSGKMRLETGAAGSTETSSKKNSRLSDYSPGNYSTSVSPRLQGSASASSVSRMNRKSLREIPRTDARLSQVKPTEGLKAYDHKKYQVIEDLTESFEAKMLASLKRQQDEEEVSVVGGDSRVTDRSPRGIAPIRHTSSQHLLHVEESPTTTSDDDTSFSTWKAPAADQLVHNYQEEMRYPHSRLSSDTLTSSNPRDWSGVFSPPIMVPCESGTAHSSNSDSDPLNSKSSPRKDDLRLSPTGGVPIRQNGSMVTETTTPDIREVTGQEEELDLLYDPCLNCYFDPNTCKYYELI